MEKIKEETEKFIKRASDFFREEIVEEKARETGFVQRQSDITGHLFLTIFTFAMSLHGTPTLNQLVGLLNALLPELDVSRDAFHQRINANAVRFFEAMLSLAIELEFPESIKLPVFDNFERILLFDSTIFQLPDALSPYFSGSGGRGSASNSGIKIVFGYDLKSAQFFYALLNGTDADHLMNNGMLEKIGANDLVLIDLGYYGVPAFAEIEAKDAFLISRLKSNVGLYRRNVESNELEEVELLDLLKYVSYEAKETEIYLKSDHKIVRVRLIMEKVPQAVEEKRLRILAKANKKKGRQATKRTRFLQGFNLHITNASPEDVPTESVRKFYTIRWQIELVFKNWKSNFKLDEVNGSRPERIKTMIYAKLLLIFIVTKMTRLASFYVWMKSQQEVSEFQSAKHFEAINQIWMAAIILDPSKINELLLNAFSFITTSCLKGKSKKRTYPIQILQTIDNAVA